MEFKDFKNLFQSHVNRIFERNEILFTTDIGKDEMWEAYLESFPAGTNLIFRERRDHDCSCCRHFIKVFGNVVAIENNSLVSIWDFKTKDKMYQPVINALSALVTSASVSNVFVTKESKFGVDYNYEQLEDKTVQVWDHFYIVLPDKFVTNSARTKESIMAEKRDIKQVFMRSLEEISDDAIKTVLEIIAQKSLYKGDEWNGALKKFLTIHSGYHKLKGRKKDLYCWEKSAEVSGAIGKIRNHSIGVLLGHTRPSHFSLHNACVGFVRDRSTTIRATV